MDRFIIAGLGNLGLKFKNTRHNSGFMVIDSMSKELFVPVKRSMTKTLAGEGIYNGKPIVLAKPKTYMNLSGESIRELVDWYKSSLDKLVIIYDDMDLPVGDIRIRMKGSAGSHNGMKSIVQQLGTTDFIRIRIGIGEPEDRDGINYVLGRFQKDEKAIMAETVKTVSAAILCIIDDGIDIAMNRYNTKKE